MSHKFTNAKVGLGVALKIRLDEYATANELYRYSLKSIVEHLLDNNEEDDYLSSRDTRDTSSSRDTRDTSSNTGVNTVNTKAHYPRTERELIAEAEKLIASEDYRDEARLAKENLCIEMDELTEWETDLKKYQVQLDPSNYSNGAVM